MANVTCYVAIPFSRDDEGNLIPGEPKEAPNGDRAKRLAQAMSEKHAGAIAAVKRDCSLRLGPEWVLTCWPEQE